MLSGWWAFGNTRIAAQGAHLNPSTTPVNFHSAAPCMGPAAWAYYGPFEHGGASAGQPLAGLPEEIRRAVREEVRRDLADKGGPVEAEAEYRIASARR
jgi:hypothetical protein